MTTVGARRLMDVRALDGGMSSAVHLLTLEVGTEVRLQVVLRRYVLDWVKEEPRAPGNEALVLRLLADTAISAPRLLAADPDGSVTGTPAIVMSALPGRLIWHPADVEPWLRQLAEALPVIHAVPVSPGLTEWAPYEPIAGLVPPPWTRRRRAWERALELYDGAQPPSARVFLHRDFHPGNVLWQGGAVSGIVDWVASCAGPVEEDVAHCRFNLAEQHGMAAADRFLAIWQGISGSDDYHPYWDLTAVVSVVSTQPNAALDDFVAAAAAKL
jgi:aminoglycoside phosphotransferase (APT) family kinase protein